MNKKEKALILLGILFISFNLRAPITAVGSVVDLIKEEYLLSSGMAGFITTLPLIAFAIISPFVSRFSQKLGFGKAMTAGLILILIGELVRSYTNVSGLFIGTALLGIGIAIGNVIIPSIIKLKFSNNVGFVTSIYTSGMCIFAAVGAGVSVLLAKGLNLGWKHSLASWLILTVITIFIWSPQFKEKVQEKVKNDTALNNDNPTQPVWKSPIAWWVTFFMGTQSLLFYTLVAWLPTIIMSKGMTDSFAGTMALTFQLTAIPATLGIPMLCDKFKKQRGLAIFTCFLYISGMLLFLFAHTPIVTLISVALMALGMGGSISLAIAFISFRSPNPVRASELSGMSQTAGYLLAAIGPILMGTIYDISKSWSLPIIILGGLIVFLAFCGWFAGNDVLIQDQAAMQTTSEPTES